MMLTTMTMMLLLMMMMDVDNDSWQSLALTYIGEDFVPDNVLSVWLIMRMSR